jgi:tetratricopeptide (TPR) repeat protein
MIYLITMKGSLMTQQALALLPSVFTSDDALPTPFIIAFTCDFQSQKPMVERQVCVQLRQTHPNARIVTINEHTPLAEFPLAGAEVARTVFVITALETLAAGNNRRPQAALFQLFLSGLTTGNETPIGYVLITAGNPANKVVSQMTRQHTCCTIPKNGGHDYLTWLLQQIVGRDDRRPIPVEEANCYVRTLAALLTEASAGHPKLDTMMVLAAVNISHCNLPWALHLAGHQAEAQALFRDVFTQWQSTVLLPGSPAVIMLDNLLRYLGGQNRMVEAQGYLEVVMELLPVDGDDMNAPLLALIRGLAKGFVEGGRLDDATVVLTLLLQSAERRTNWPIKLWCLMRLAALPHLERELALVYAGQALAAAQVVGNPGLIQQTMFALVESLVDAGRYAEVDTLLTKLEVEAQANHDQSLLGLITQERAVVLDYQDRPTQAAKMQRKALAYFRRSATDPSQLSYAVRTLGVMEYRAGEIGRARAHFKQAYDLLEGDRTILRTDLGSEFAVYEAAAAQFGYAARWSIRAARAALEIDVLRATQCMIDAEAYHDDMPPGKGADAIEAEILEVSAQLQARAAALFA